MVKAPLAIRFLPAVAATVLLGLVLATHPLSTVPRAIALAFVVGAWLAALLVRRKDVRAHATVVAAIGAATAAGQVDAGLPYGIGCALLLLACAVSLRAARTTQASPARERHAGSGSLRAAVVLVATASVVTAALVSGLPRLAERIERRLTAMFGGDGNEATAFSTTMVLGSTRGMLQSDAIVLRIDGPRPDYLRGAVYDRYEAPFWVTSAAGRQRRAVPAVATAAPDSTRITLVRGAPVGEDMRWFLPGQACDHGVASGQLEIDAFGVARRGRGDDPASITYRATGCAESPSVAKPSEYDLEVPLPVRRSLEPIAAGWTAGATTEHEKLAAIQRELSRFEYSLAVPRSVVLDPVVDFVSVHRAGHCEMFASAMVLMARTQGIPARVVGGYRVTEVNPLTGKAVVRDRNAHAWVEAWFDGAWHGMDPTPASESFAPRANAIDHVGDLASAALERVAIGLARLGLLGTAVVLAVLIACLFAFRWVMARMRERRSRQPRSGSPLGLPLPCFESLCDVLARAGHMRDDSEPIEAFARRLGAVEAPWARDTAQALRDYAGLRYGNVGDQSDVVQAINRCAATIRNAVRP
jgi:protein-glutamine gamma-glutamyltransferase